MEKKLRRKEYILIQCLINKNLGQIIFYGNIDLKIGQLNDALFIF